MVDLKYMYFLPSFGYGYKHVDINSNKVLVYSI